MYKVSVFISLVLLVFLCSCSHDKESLNEESNDNQQSAYLFNDLDDEINGTTIIEDEKELETVESSSDEELSEEQVNTTSSDIIIEMKVYPLTEKEKEKILNYYDPVTYELIFQNIDIVIPENLIQMSSLAVDMINIKDEALLNMNVLSIDESSELIIDEFSGVYKNIYFGIDYISYISGQKVAKADIDKYSQMYTYVEDNIDEIEVYADLYDMINQAEDREQFTEEELKSLEARNIQVYDAIYLIRNHAYGSVSTLLEYSDYELSIFLENLYEWKLNSVKREFAKAIIEFELGINLNVEREKYLKTVNE